MQVTILPVNRPLGSWVMGRWGFIVLYLSRSESVKFSGIKFLNQTNGKQYSLQPLKTLTTFR